jgi:hypothetical protein
MKQCYQKHNAHNKDEQLDRSLCALEMNSFMSAAVDSETCIRRSSATAIINPGESVNIVNIVDYLGTLFFLHYLHHHQSFMELGHLLTRSGLTCPEASSKVCHDSCQSGSSV